MDQTALRAVQAPLKERYREEPATALVTLHAEGSLTDGLTCSVQTGRALVAAGLHPASGGDGLSVCSGDMLLQALVACAGVTLQAVATSLGIEVRDGTVTAQQFTLDELEALAKDRSAQLTLLSATATHPWASVPCACPSTSTATPTTTSSRRCSGSPSATASCSRRCVRPRRSGPR